MFKLKALSLGTIKDPVRGISVSNIFTNGLKVLYPLIAMIFVAYLIYGGILYITAAGDANKVKAAQTTLINAVIGLMLALFAFVITYIIGKVLNVELV